mmetsp:Transcript_4536/g.12032  ORF Transcript_4536/g.12032 Transcript_4536/m.12032 type:complete len:523 (+) Transcript_4536:31-1599(+)
MLRRGALLLLVASAGAFTNQEGRDFLEANIHRPGVVVLESGLQYKVIEEGKRLVFPTEESMVFCRYEGRTAQNWPNGETFDSTYGGKNKPMPFKLKEVIPGWTEALQLMAEGDKWQLFIPADLAYGEKGAGGIPANEALVFTVELVEVPNGRVDEDGNPLEGAVKSVSPLFDAVATGKLTKVKEALEAGGREYLEVAGPQSNTPLHVAAIAPHNEITSLLIGEGANVKAEMEGGFTALHVAAANGRTVTISELLKAGAEINLTSEDGRTPLHLVVTSGCEDAMAVILKAGAIIDAIDGKRMTPLHHAALDRQASIAKILVEHGASLSAAAEEGMTPLHYAARGGGGKVVQALLRLGADVEAKDDDGATPLLVAAGMGSVDAAFTLLVGEKRDTYAKADGNATDSTGMTALHLAALDDNSEMTEFLSTRGVPVEAQAERNFTALHVAAIAGKVASFTALLDAGADLMALDAAGATPLERAGEEIRVAFQKWKERKRRENEGDGQDFLAAHVGRGGEIVRKDEV